MSEPARQRMTSDEFIAWAMEQPETCRYELIAGEVVPMAPERSAHASSQRRTSRAAWLRGSKRMLDCQAKPRTAWPSKWTTTLSTSRTLLVRCGPPLPPDAVKLRDPVIVVEVLSPSTSARDVGPKLIDYFRLASVQHYLIVGTENRTIIHHERGEDGVILTRIVRDASVVLDPPGITLTDCFPPGAV